MIMDKKMLETKVDAKQKEIEFSGTVLVKTKTDTWTKSYGWSNRAEKIHNTEQTRYGIASGSKPITAAAISLLMDQGKLTPDDRLLNLLDHSFPHFDQAITIHQLLTHTSGVPDYFDEDVMDDFEELWVKHPMYLIRELSDFLPLFQDEKMKSEPGKQFHYNNAGYILLGLVVEKVSGVPFDQFVQKQIFDQLGMNDSGYFELDSLPERTALGYIEKPDGGYRTNLYSLPAKSASDGGVFVTARDMQIFWDALVGNKLLSEEATKRFLTPHVEEDDGFFYGYGHYMEVNQSVIRRHIMMGYDPGVNFRAAFFPQSGVNIIVCSNLSDGAYEIITEVQETLNRTK